MLPKGMGRLDGCTYFGLWDAVCAFIAGSVLAEYGRVDALGAVLAQGSLSGKGAVACCRAEGSVDGKAGADGVAANCSAGAASRPFDSGPLPRLASPAKVDTGNAANRPSGVACG